MKVYSRYQCASWPVYDTSLPRSGRCGAPATHWLYAPDGKANPGGHYCEEHGSAITTEYAEKINEHWTLSPLEFERC